MVQDSLEGSKPLVYPVSKNKHKIISEKITVFNTSQTEMRTKLMRTELDSSIFRSTPHTKLQSLILVKAAQYFVKQGRTEFTL